MPSNLFKFTMLLILQKYANIIFYSPIIIQKYTFLIVFRLMSPEIKFLK